MEAYQLYLQGRFYFNKRNGEALKQSINYFNQAIKTDPSYALAYSGLSDSYSLLSSYGAAPPQESLPKARAAARKAVELDDALAEAHTSLANVLVYEWKWDESIKEFQKAIALNPNYATAHHWYSDGPLLAQGRFDEAMSEMKRAQELDPFSLIINVEVGMIYAYSRQPDKAIEQLHKTIEMDPNFYFAHWNLAEAYVLKGAYPDAIKEYQTALRLSTDQGVLGFLAQAYARAGKKDEALKLIEQMKSVSQQSYVTPYAFAEAYAALDDKDQAFQWLEMSYQLHAPEISML
jgi:tetratricopeptide (TPR) repeat protein